MSGRTGSIRDGRVGGDDASGYVKELSYPDCKKFKSLHRFFSFVSVEVVVYRMEQKENAKRYDKSGIRTHAPFETRNAPKNMCDQIA